MAELWSNPASNVVRTIADSVSTLNATIATIATDTGIALSAVTDIRSHREEREPATLPVALCYAQQVEVEEHLCAAQTHRVPVTIETFYLCQDPETTDAVGQCYALAALRLVEHLVATAAITGVYHLVDATYGIEASETYGPTAYVAVMTCILLARTYRRTT